MNDKGDELARLPLRVMIGRETAEGLFVDEPHIVRPGDTTYDEDYAHAVAEYRAYGTPMPYADIQARASDSPR